jgi:hypothetical protein
MKELYVDTGELFDERGVPLPQPSPIKTGWVVAWWTFWILTAIAASVSIVMTGRVNHDNTVQNLIDHTRVSIVEDVVRLVRTFLTLIVVRNYSRVEPLPETQTPAAY